jgi:hypothetical protein
MNPVHYAAMLFDGRWKIVGKGLRWGDYPALEPALQAARRMARQSRGLGLEVQLHVHEDTGLLHLVDLADLERDHETPPSH